MTKASSIPVKRLNVFERYLTLWVALCMVAGVLPDAEGKITVTVKSYLKPGDELGLVVDGTKNTLRSASVSSFTGEGDKKSPVTAKVSYAALEDGTIYPAKEDLEIPAQELKVAVENSGYRKQTP